MSGVYNEFVGPRSIEDINDVNLLNMPIDEQQIKTCSDELFSLLGSKLDEDRISQLRATDDYK